MDARTLLHSDPHVVAKVMRSHPDLYRRCLEELLASASGGPDGGPGGGLLADIAAGAHGKAKDTRAVQADPAAYLARARQLAEMTDAQISRLGWLAERSLRFRANKVWESLR